MEQADRLYLLPIDGGAAGTQWVTTVEGYGNSKVQIFTLCSTGSRELFIFCTHSLQAHMI
jgi:hypothetical protein